jgi:hypothetical protein
MHTKSRNVTEIPAILKAAPAALGTSAKSHSPSRAERFANQATARILLPKERVRYCFRSRRSEEDVSVWRSDQYQRAHFKGLKTCGSVWHCPVCAAKISERRRGEMEAAMAVHQSRGGVVLLLTLTNSHHKRHRLSDLLEGQTKALTLFRGGKKAVSIFKGMGVVGMVRAWEVTHGESGWHPHFHILVFLSGPLDDLQGWRDCLARRWQNCCRSAGLPIPDLIHGCDLQDGTYAARYASKWGLSDEVTKGHTKKGREGGKTPFDLLREVTDTGEAGPAVLFQEYAICFKGKRQLVWSPGLKAALAVEDVTDEELAESTEESSVLLGYLSVEDWRVVIKTHSRAAVLDAAEQSWPAVLDLLLRLHSKPPSKNPTHFQEDENHVQRSTEGFEGTSRHPFVLPLNARDCTGLYRQEHRGAFDRI